MKNIAKAIIEVMKSVKGMEKNSRVGAGKSAYNGTKYADVAEVFNDAMAENGLCILPIGVEDEVTINRWEEDDTYNKTPPYPKKSKQSIFTKVKTKYMLLHETGESIEIIGYGHGIDTQDKSAGKATTYALKNALLYTFLTPVGKIDDADKTHSDDLPIKPSTASKPNSSYVFGVSDKLLWVKVEQVEAMIKTIPTNRQSVLAALPKYRWSKENKETITKALDK